MTNDQAAFRGVVARKMLAVEAEKRAAAEAATKEMAATRVAVRIKMYCAVMIRTLQFNASSSAIRN